MRLGVHTYVEPMVCLGHKSYGKSKGIHVVNKQVVEGHLIEVGVHLGFTYWKAVLWRRT